MKFVYIRRHLVGLPLRHFHNLHVYNRAVDVDAKQPRNDQRRNIIHELVVGEESVSSVMAEMILDRTDDGLVRWSVSCTKSEDFGGPPP